MKPIILLPFANKFLYRLILFPTELLLCELMVIALFSQWFRRSESVLSRFLVLCSWAINQFAMTA